LAVGTEVALATGGGRRDTALMSQENVERARQGIDAFNRHDIPGSLRVMDPEIVWEHRLAEMHGTCVGPDEVIGWYHDLWEHFDSIEIVCSDLRDLGDRVLGLGEIHAIGKGSGAETVFPYSVVVTYKDGRMTHYIDYGDRDKALEATGLAQQ
jgi:ketosteroid isomerase-like protein